ncbi:MAG: NADH:ubiquinone reductase (Na(+)-transporting) subunit B [Bacteroidales bacterium]|nr:NADH:ubiquinone reductase (Na(+)-transporting) subunit B [Bacteroidales bacterium]
MKALRRYLDKIKPNFEKGGKLYKFKSVFEGFETFLFVPNKTTFTGSHVRDAIDMKRTMIIVVMALMPAMLFGMWNVGYQHYTALGLEETLPLTFWYGFLKVLPLILVSYIVGLGIEFAFAQIRGHEINEGFLVSGMLIPLIVPVTIPLWMVAVATAFAVIIGKEVFGGTGMNIVNPALTARAFLFFAYPKQMSGEIWVSGLEGEKLVDGYSGATAMAQATTTIDMNKSLEVAKQVGDSDLVSSLQSQIGATIDGLPSAYDAFMGWIPGSIGETSTLAILLGAIVLIFTGIGSLRIMLSVFAGGFLMGLLLNAVAVNPYMEIDAYYHLLIGGFAFGAVFMATDPVTASQTARGKIIYGFLIGVIAVIIRVLNPAYPEGMMLAILLMNVFAPLIDHYVVQGNIKRRLKRAKA